MFGFSLLGVWIFHLCTFTPGKANKDPRSCITKREDNLNAIAEEHCVVTKDDINLLCPPDELVTILSLKLAVKGNVNGCMKRILTHRNRYCCNSAAKDVLYDGHCLQDVWNKEDRVHYQKFVNQALQKCLNTSECVLNSKMFANLQTEIPVSKIHSSYFQILYQCMKAPTSPIRFCSSTSITGREIHLRGITSSKETSNKTCTCRVLGNSIVRAMDIRTNTNGLILMSDSKSIDVSQLHLPLFGFREITTGRNINISIKSGKMKAGEHVWLHVSGTNGKDVTVSCGETPSIVVKTLATPAATEAIQTHTQEAVYMGYWPLIYVASGSIFTIVLVACIIGGLLITRYRKEQKRRCNHQSHQCSGELHDDPRWHHYASVVYSQNQDTYMKTYPRSTLIRTPQPQHTPTTLSSADIAARRMETTRPSSPELMTPGTSCDVSQLEAFLKCKEEDR